MIFVTVGTHEQQFNRLVKKVDELKGSGVLQEEVIIQTGYSTYEPINCIWKKLFSYSEMNRLVTDARIVITHGGPSSFIAPLQQGKMPIVVPRQKEFGEHVNDHQVTFCKEVQARQKNIVVIEDISKLGEAIMEYDKLVEEMPINVRSNNERFCKSFTELINEIMK